MDQINPVRTTSEDSKCYQFSSNDCDLLSKEKEFQEIDPLKMAKEDIDILFETLNKTVNERKLACELEITRLNVLQKRIIEKQRQFILPLQKDACDISGPNLPTCDEHSHDIWNCDSMGASFKCVEHTETRRAWHIKTKQTNALMCSACKECAFCPPKWIECWEPKKHLPGKKWKAELTQKVTSPEVVTWFKTCPNVTKRTTQGIKNKKYLQLCFQRTPVLVLNFASSTAPPVRQCCDSTGRRRVYAGWNARPYHF